MSKAPRPVVIDFETVGIEGRPHYPPFPVGVSIKLPGKSPQYYAWGHATGGNNCTWLDGQEALEAVWDHPDGLLFQNAKFDIDVACVHMGMQEPSWERIHDTLYLLFLDDPHQTELGLKPSATRLLDMDPEEQDAVAEWLVTNQPVPGVRITKGKNAKAKKDGSKSSYFGAYIAWCPGDIVGKYANGDVVRTERLFNLLWTKTKKRGMLGAYDRERKLMPILLETERRGLPVDLPRLRVDVTKYIDALGRVEAWICKRLNAGPDLNISSGDQLMAAMLAAGVVNEGELLLTKGGKYQTNKDALLVAVTDAQLLAMLKYKSQLDTCLGTFMIPWLKTALESGGMIFTSWNQTRSPKVGGAMGTRTGRLSSTPNFQNIPKEFEPLFRHYGAKGPGLPACPLRNLPPLPLVRSYVTAFPGHVLIDRDYSQQEPRILAHFEQGGLLDLYLSDPWTDLHDSAKLALEHAGKYYPRKAVKTVNLGIIYGMGAASMAIKNDMTVVQARQLKNEILRLYPGLSNMQKDMKTRARTNTPIRTWGEREYYCEPPRIVDGKTKTYEYKMINVLVQGSAADCTKEAIIRFYHECKRMKKTTWYLLINVHDELVVSAPEAEAAKAMEVLRECMESIEFDVPMLSEGSLSRTNWAELKSYDTKGKIIYR